MDLALVKDKMQKVLDYVRTDIASIRTGRATPSLVENIIIGAYGGTTQMRVLELAGIATPDSQSLTITPYDASIIGDIRRDIIAANVGLNPVIDNNVLRIAVPALTTERRQEYVKMLHVKLEDGRVKIASYAMSAWASSNVWPKPKKLMKMSIKLKKISCKK
jgi:ribosome recycling factor